MAGIASDLATTSGGDLPGPYQRWSVDPGALPDVAPLAPPWLLGPVGQAFLQGLSYPMDAALARAREAVKASFIASAPVDALPVLGDEVGMQRGVIEPEDVYRGRIADAWDLWQWSGTAYGMLLACRAAGYPNVLLQVQTGARFQLRVDLAGDPYTDLVISYSSGATHLGGTPAELWTDFAALVLRPWPTWWSAAPPDGSDDQRAFTTLLQRWKSAHSRCVRVEAVDGVAWGVSGLAWGSFTWGAGTITPWAAPT